LAAWNLQRRNGSTFQADRVVEEDMWRRTAGKYRLEVLALVDIITLASEAESDVRT
jgi:hypothetical protein